MFGRKDKDKTADSLISFLEEADKLYIKAFETRSIGVMKSMFTRECCYAISRWIIAQASSRYFSDDKFRCTEWNVLQRTQTYAMVQKTCTYRDIKLSSKRSMKVSDDYSEVWEIEISPSGFVVTNIKDFKFGGYYD